MIKVNNITKIENYCIEILFNNGEQKTIDFKPIIDNNYNDIFIKKLLNINQFKQAKVGTLGEIYWENMATMKDTNGGVITCNYDCSPEFIYMNSK
jgi:hypothetical protein